MLVTADAGAELVHCPIEIQPLGVECDDGFEARGFQCALHCGGVVGRIGQLQIRVGVVAIADDQRDARLGGHTPGGRQQYQECAKSNGKAHTLTCAVANQMGLDAKSVAKATSRQLSCSSGLVLPIFPVLIFSTVWRAWPISWQTWMQSTRWLKTHAANRWTRAVVTQN